MMFFTVSADHEAHHFCRKRPSVFPSVYGSIADAQLFGKLRLGQPPFATQFQNCICKGHLLHLSYIAQYSIVCLCEASPELYIPFNKRQEDPVLLFCFGRVARNESKKKRVTAAVTIFLITKIALDCLNLAAVKGYPSFLISNIIFIPRFLQIHGTTYMSVELAPSLYVNTAVR